MPAWTGGVFPDVPFMDRMTITFVLIIVIMILMSLLKPEENSGERLVNTDRSMFKVSGAFIAGSVLIVGILTALYTVFW